MPEESPSSIFDLGPSFEIFSELLSALLVDVPSLIFIEAFLSPHSAFFDVVVSLLVRFSVFCWFPVFLGVTLFALVGICLCSLS